MFLYNVQIGEEISNMIDNCVALVAKISWIIVIISLFLLVLEFQLLRIKKLQAFGTKWVNVLIK